MGNPPGAPHADEERFALVSVLQELTVAALELFDPRGSADLFLERLAERLGCYVTLIVAMGADGRSALEGASGLSPQSRAMPIPVETNRALVSGEGEHRLPYPELLGRELVMWRFPVTTPPAAVLILFFEGEPRLPSRYRGMLRRLTDILGRVLEHRSLFARSIESERRLDEKRSIIECLSEASPDGVLFLDHAGEVFFHNRKFVELWGLEAITGSRSGRHLLNAASAQVTDPAGFLARAGAPKDADAPMVDELVLKDGRVFERQVRLVRSAEGVSHGHALFFRDITERKRSEAERERLLVTERAARAAAEEAIRARDDFLSIASHELRTPLTSLLLATQQVTRAAQAHRAEIPASLLRALDTPRRQAERLVRLVDALLDVSRIQVGRLRLECEDVDLAEVVREVVARFQQDLERVRSTVEIHVRGSAVGNWDRSRIDQVVTNLVSNAIKYGRGAHIELTINGTDAKTVRLAVRDRGIGIDPAKTGRLFERFERAVSSRQYGGLGLGLFIVRQIVEMHGGTVDVTSEPGVGSTFTVSLPRLPARTAG